jgi:hypothetical protein
LTGHDSPSLDGDYDEQATGEEAEFGPALIRPDYSDTAEGNYHYEELSGGVTA